MVSVRLKKRAQPLTSPLATMAILLASIVGALAVCAVLVRLAGSDPLKAYWAMAVGAFGTTSGLVKVVMKATPLLLTGLGTAVAFRSGQWNIGGDGQIYMGALGATLVGLGLCDLPPALLLPLAVLGGFLAGALWAALAALLKAYRGVNEIISTLMLTYIAILAIQYLVDGPLQGVSDFMPQTDMVAEAARFPLLFPPFRLHGGTILAVLMTGLIYVLLWHTPVGYELRAVGHSPAAARYGGIRVVRNIVLVMVLSGGLSALAGVSEVLGIHYRLYDGISPGYGFTGIIVALLGRLNPLGLVASSILFSGMIVGANNMQSVVGVPSAIAGIIQGVVVLFILSSEVLLEYRPVLHRPVRSSAAQTGVADHA